MNSPAPQLALQNPSASPVAGGSVADILATLYESAAGSVSLLSSRHPATVNRQSWEISKFLLLGQRGGGRPIRLAIFAGLDAGAIETTAAVARLLIQYELNPALARDFALFAYPVVNALGFTEPATPLAEFERRYALDKPDGDVQFFKKELQQWVSDGMITLRFDLRASSFYAKVRSQVIGREVAAPALDQLRRTLPVEESARAVLRRPEDRFARLADHAYGKLSAPPGPHPHPFEVEIFAPGSIEVEQRIVGLFLFVQEVLRNYRRLISHAANL